MVKCTKKNKKKTKTKPKPSPDPPKIRSTDAATHSDLHSSLSDSIFKDSFDKFLGDRDVRRKQLNLKENVDASFNRDSSLECSAISEVPDTSTITHVLRPYDHLVCSTPNLKFSNVPIINLNTSDILNDHGINPSKNHSSDIFASYVGFENSFIGSQTETGTANKHPIYTSQLCDKSTSRVAENIEISHNTIDKAKERSISTYDLRPKKVPSFSRVTKRRKAKPKKTAAEAILQKENIEESILVSFRSSRNSTSKLGSIFNETRQVPEQGCSPGEACEIISFKKPQLTRYDNKYTRVLRDKKNCTNIGRNSCESKLINRQLELVSKIQTTSHFSEVTLGALLVSKNSSALKSDEYLGITNESNKSTSSGQSSSCVSTQNVNRCVKKFGDSTEEESIFFRRLRSNPLKPRSNDENSSMDVVMPAMDISSHVDSLPISNTIHSSDNSSSSVNSLNNSSNTHQSIESWSSLQENNLTNFTNYNLSQESSLPESTLEKIQMLKQSENIIQRVRRNTQMKLSMNHGYSSSLRSYGDVSSSFGMTSQISQLHESLANSLNSSSNMSVKLQSSCDNSQNSENGSLPRQALSNVQNYLINDPHFVRRSRRLKKDRNESEGPGDISNELYGSHFASYLTGNSSSGLQNNNSSTLTNGHNSQRDSQNGSALSKEVTMESNSSNNVEKCHRNTPRKQKSDTANLGSSQYSSNNSTESNGCHYDSNVSEDSFAGFQTDSLTSLTKDNISQGDSLKSSVLLQAGSTLGSYSLRRSLRSTEGKLVNDHSNSNVSQSSVNNSNELYRSLYASNLTAVSCTGLQDDNSKASITNDNISQEESLSGSTLTKVESSLNSNSNNLVTMIEMQCNDERRSTIVDQSKSKSSHNNINLSNEGPALVNIFNVTERKRKSANSTTAGSSNDSPKPTRFRRSGSGCSTTISGSNTSSSSSLLTSSETCPPNTSTSTLVIADSVKSIDNVNMESVLNIVPCSITNESTSNQQSATINTFKPSKFLNNLKKTMFMNNLASYVTVPYTIPSACDIQSKPVHSATSNDINNLNPDVNNPTRNFATSNTVDATNQLMSPREELFENTNRLNFVNVTKRKRKQCVNGASNLYNLPAIMESSDDVPESEQTCPLPAVMDSVAFALPENVHSSTCATLTENDPMINETHRYSVSLHSGKWRRALSLYRKHSLVKSAFLLEQTDVESTNLKISLSNESNRQTLRHSVSFNLSRDNFVDFNETSDRRAARRRRTSVVLPSIDAGRITDLDFVSTYKARDTILRKCGQSEPLEFSDIYSESALRQCRKIGEGVYGEVFMNKTDAGRAIVLKIIPIEGSLEVNGEPQKKFDEILSEIVIALQLSTLRNGKEYMTSSFAEVVQVRCVQGRYPNHLVDLWELYRDNYQTENDHPEIFTDDQLYIVFELANGGQDLEAFQFANALQSKSAFQQMALALAIAEEKLQFEHRDLHWGNILLSPTDEKFVNFKLNGNLLQIPAEGIKVTIIDYTLSRMLYEGIVLYNDLSNDDELFTAHGDYQFDIYRLMKSNLDNDWQRFEPFNNVLWLHYIIDKLINGARYKNTKSRKHRLAIEDLMVIRDEITNYKSAVDSVSNV